MNTIKLYAVGDGTFVLQMSPTRQYHILNGAVLKSNYNVAVLEETTFDLNVQINLANAIASAELVVTNVELLEAIMANVQEKVEDND